MKKTTEELLSVLNNAPSPEKFIADHKQDLVQTSLEKELHKILEAKELEKPDVIRQSCLDRTYAYQIFSGMKQPSRDKLLMLIIAMKISYEEAQTLLKHNGYPVLYAKNKRDSVIIFALKKQVSVLETNDLLFELGLLILE